MYGSMRLSRNTVRLNDMATMPDVRCRLRSGEEAFAMEPLTLAAANRRSGARLMAAGRGCGPKTAGAGRTPRVM